MGIISPVPTLLKQVLLSTPPYTCIHGLAECACVSMGREELAAAWLFIDYNELTMGLQEKKAKPSRREAK